MERVLKTVRAFDGVLELAPGRGSEFPEIAWGDHFFYYAPNGQIPQKTQPYATIVTKDYPGEPSSNLGPEGRWRVNVHVGRSKFTELTGESPRDFNSSDRSSRDFSEADVFMPHPVYGALGWVAVVSPGDHTTLTLLELLRAAHEDERRRVDRRAQAHDRSDKPGWGR